MRKLILSLALALPVFAQNLPIVDGIYQTPQAIFDSAYWKSKPPAVQALKPNGDGSDKSALAQDLALKGEIIDVPIMVWGWDPYIVMTLRRDLGFTWVPSALQNPVQVVPGLNFPGLPSYDPSNPPKGSIKVSADPADFPPFIPPPPPAPLPDPKILVGIHAFGSLYNSTQAGFAVPDGTVIYENGMTCTKHVVQGLMGVSHTFECLSANHGVLVIGTGSITHTPYYSDNILAPIGR